MGVARVCHLLRVFRPAGFSGLGLRFNGTIRRLYCRGPQEGQLNIHGQPNQELRLELGQSAVNRIAAGRAIKFGEGDRINEPALKELVRAAVVLNSSKPAAKSPSRGERSGEKSRSRG